MDNRTDMIEERLAHLQKTVDELSDVLAKREKELDVLSRRVAMLMEREAAREVSEGAAVVYGDERPPHY